MKSLLITLLLVLTSCGDDSVLVETITVETEVVQEFEGIYTCNNYSYLELLMDEDGRVTFETTGQSLNSINPENRSLATHPIISDRDLIPHSGKLTLAPRNYTYSSSTYDLEEDVSGSNITGSRRTDVTVTKTSKGVKVLISIFDGAINNNINAVVVKRTITCTEL